MERTARERTTRERRHQAAERVRSEEAPVTSLIVDLQASAGNRAVTQLLQRMVTVPGKKKKPPRQLTKRQEVEEAIFEIFGKDKYEALKDLLTSNPEAGQALDEFLLHNDTIHLDDPSSFTKLIARIQTDAEATRKRNEEKQGAKEVTADESTLALPLQQAPTIERGTVNKLYGLCEPLYKAKDKPGAGKKKGEIQGELTTLKKSARNLDPIGCLTIFGELGSFEITEVCGWAGASKQLKELENALRNTMAGDEKTPEKFVLKQLQSKLAWITPQHFERIFVERSGKHGATSASANINLTDVMHGWGEIVACAPSIDIINDSGMSCLKTLRAVPLDPHAVGFTLLHKVAAGNIRRFKMATIGQCMKRLKDLLPVMLDHGQVTPGAKEGICESLASAITKMNSKHLVRDLRQLEMLHTYLGLNRTAMCTRFAFTGPGWEFDIEISHDEEKFILEIEGLPATINSPEAITSYLRERHDLKQTAAREALGPQTVVKLGVPANIPPEVLSGLRDVIAVAGSPNQDAPQLQEIDEENDEGDI